MKEKIIKILKEELSLWGECGKEIVNMENIETAAQEVMEAQTESTNKLKAEIAAIIAQHFSCDASGKFLGVYSVEELYNKLRQLSAV